MLPYKAEPLKDLDKIDFTDAWQVTSEDGNGRTHLTIFIGPISELRADTYAERFAQRYAEEMTKNTKDHIPFPDE